MGTKIPDHLSGRLIPQNLRTAIASSRRRQNLQDNKAPRKKKFLRLYEFSFQRRDPRLPTYFYSPRNLFHPFARQRNADFFFTEEKLSLLKAR